MMKPRLGCLVLSACLAGSTLGGLARAAEAPDTATDAATDAAKEDDVGAPTQDTEAEPDATEEDQRSGEGESGDGETPEIFLPSEEISEDLSVPFPVDI